MHYATHCVGPVLALQRNRAETLSCFGSGRIHEEMIPIHGSPFAIESCQVTFKDSDVSARIIRSLYNTARQYRESFDAYGSKKSYEWPLIEGEDPVIHTIGKPEPEIPSGLKCLIMLIFCPRKSSPSQVVESTIQMRNSTCLLLKVVVMAVRIHTSFMNS